MIGTGAAGMQGMSHKAVAVAPIGAVNTANPGGGIERLQMGARRPVHNDISDAGLEMGHALPAGEERQLTHADLEVEVGMGRKLQRDIDGGLVAAMLLLIDKADGGSAVMDLKVERHVVDRRGRAVLIGMDGVLQLEAIPSGGVDGDLPDRDGEKD